MLSRGALLRALHTATVAAITSTRRGSPTEVPLGIDEGLKGPSYVNLATFPQAALRRFVGTVEPAKMHEVCAALPIALDC